MAFILLVIIALFSGLLGSLVGLGGGVVLVPATLYIGLNLGMINKKNTHNIRLKVISWILVDRSLQ